MLVDDRSAPPRRARPAVAVVLAAAALGVLWGCSGDSAGGGGATAAAPAAGGGANGARAGAAGGGANGARAGASGGGGMAAGGRGARGGGGATLVIAQKVEATMFSDETEALGTAKANEAVDITAKSTNRVVALHLREGAYVKEGDVLVEFDGTEARANLAAAEALARDSKSQYERGKLLYQNKLLSESDIVQLEAKMLNSRSAVEAAQARVNDTVIRATFSGRIGLRNTSVGALVAPGQIITTLDDISVIKLDFTVPETFLAVIREGESLDARSAAYPESVFRGKVGSVATRVDPVSRSIVVRALLDNRDRRLKPGMFMTVRLKRPATRVMLVPEQALVPEGEVQSVYIVDGDVARRVAVELGRRRPGLVEVVSGLKVGDIVVVEGGEKIQDGAKVQVRMTGRQAASS